MKRKKRIEKKEKQQLNFYAPHYIYMISQGFLKQKFFNLQCKNKKNKTTNNIQFLCRQNNADGLLLVAGFFFFVNVYLCFSFVRSLIHSNIKKYEYTFLFNAFL